MKKVIFSLAALALVIGGANAGVAGSKGQAPVAAQKAQAPAAKAQSPAKAQAPAAKKAQAPAAKTQAPAKGQAASKPQAAEAHEGPVGRLRDRVGGLRERLRERFGN